MSLNRDFEEIYEFYVQSLIEMIGEKHNHIDTKELNIIWKDIKKPSNIKKKKTDDKQILNNNFDFEYEKKKNQLASSLNSMKYDDLYRHCLRNGIQPPNNRNDMIKAIITKMNPL